MERIADAIRELSDRICTAQIRNRNADKPQMNAPLQSSTDPNPHAEESSTPPKRGESDQQS